MLIDPKPHNYEFFVVPDEFSEESYEIYKEYQMNVHKEKPEKITKEGYTNFLCNSSLVKEPPSENYRYGLGSFHMLHKIDGNLAAVSVLDILPTGLSAVYLFYSSQFTFLSPGTLTAIKEIEFVNQNLTQNFRYYYMGFYIDTCQKMKYKGEFHPSELLCPESYIWVPILDCLTNKSHNFLELAGSLSKNPEMDLTTLDVSNFVIQNAKISLQRKVYSITDLNPRGIATVLQILSEALPNIGKSLFKRLIYSFG